MRLDLSLCLPDGSEQDVGIDAAEWSPLGEIIARALAAAGCAGDETVIDWRGVPLDADTPLGDSGLRSGDRLLVGAPCTAPAPHGLRIVVVNGPDAGLSVPLSNGMVVGREADCVLALSDPDVSRHHARLEVTATGVRVHDLASTNGTCTNDEPVATASLGEDDLLRIGDTTLQLRSAAPQRVAEPAATAPIDLPAVSERNSVRFVGLGAAIVPALGGVLLAVMLQSRTYLVLALLSPLVLLLTAAVDRLRGRRGGRRERTRVDAELRRAEAAIAAGLRAEAGRRRRAHPDPLTLAEQVAAPGGRPWQRRRGDTGLLTLRLGLTSLPANLQIRRQGAAQGARMLSAVPLTVTLRDGPLGLTGPRPLVDGLARWCLLQLAVHVSPRDLRFVPLLVDSEHWRWVRWLPHTHRPVARTARTRGDVVTAIHRLIDERLAEQRRTGGDWSGPWSVLVVDAVASADLPRLAEVLSAGLAVGITALCLGRATETLPGGCGRVARPDGETGARVAFGAHCGVVADRVTEGFAEDVARSLAGFPVPDEDARLSGSCEFDELHDRAGLTVEDVLLRWKLSDHSPSALVGVSEEGALRLDLVQDGPHALVAGTTGAGKSELLRSWIAGLAFEHPPDDVAFVLVDYKGGAAFAECAQLPHTAGMVTDLDPAEVRRVLSSLDSELRRREMLFAEHGIAEWLQYRELDPEEPLPRLIVVVDEFAALASELPEFVHGLISLAQRGRSLGIHLVLATQRPNGVISPEIRANASLRIALRTVSGPDSADIIDSPAASSISAAQPGRGYVLLGGRRLLFQSAFTGGASARTRDRAPTVTLLDEWRERFDTEPRAAAPAEATQLASLVDCLRSAAARSGGSEVRRPWLPPLPRSLPLASLAQPGEPDRVAIALADRPLEQRQVPFCVAFGSSLAYVGRSRSGRSTALRSLAVAATDRHTPAQLHLHVIDSGGLTDLAGLPHLGTVLHGSDVTAVDRLLALVEEELGTAAPHRLVLLVDDWDHVVAADESGQLRLAERLIELARRAPSTGLTLAVGGGRDLLATRTSAAFTERIVLPLGQREDYLLAGIAERDVPRDPMPGRGVLRDDTQVHIAQADPGMLDRIAAGHACSSAPANRIVVRSLPARVRRGDVLPAGDGVVLGLGGDGAAPIAVDLFAGRGRLLVAGPPRSGRTTLLRSIAAQAAGRARVLVAAPPRSELTHDAAGHGWDVLHTLHARSELTDDPGVPTLLLVDDSETLLDTPLGDALTDWLRRMPAGVAAVVAGRSDDLAVTYRGIAADVRKSRCAVLLQPSSIDGELVGVPLPRRRPQVIPGRGLLIADPAWRDPVPTQIQIAVP
ncbi:MAG TPA: FtsK/SpoIIIE domain-containing protein [Jatrophihabitans sp.]|jgi:S-DNA-T family DNA segregation ATPase FtsK/SpoIIIE